MKNRSGIIKIVAAVTGAVSLLCKIGRAHV